MQIVGRISNMGNLCLMLHIFGNSQIRGKSTESVEGLLIWMFFEMLMEISTIVATVIFLVIRSFDRGSWELEMAGGDINNDFVSAYTT